MSNKTDILINEYDFAEKAGELHEITVTITLAEYRALIEDRCYNEKAIDELQKTNELLYKKNKDLKQQNRLIINYFFADCPELKEAAKHIIAAVRKAYGNTEKKKGHEE